MAINRTPFNAIVDDDGSGTVGTPWNKTQIAGVILDPADVDLATKVIGPASAVVNRVAIFNDTTGKLLADGGQTIAAIIAAGGAAAVTTGSWTPAWTSSGGLSGQVYSAQTGHWIKVGSLVVAFYNLGLATKGTITGNVAIYPLPFVVNAGGADSGFGWVTFFNMATNWVHLWFYPDPGQPWAWLRGGATATTNNNFSVTGADLTSTSGVFGAVIYRT